MKVENSTIVSELGIAYNMQTTTIPDGCHTCGATGMTTEYTEVYDEDEDEYVEHEKNVTCAKCGGTGIIPGAGPLHKFLITT